ncbi:hypothetical protein AMTR_s00070p00104420, partial [Amborella trichopoda]
YNQRLKERHLERLQIEDPILVKDLDPTSEWLVEPDATDEPVFEGESLTWTQVQEAAEETREEGSYVEEDDNSDDDDLASSLNSGGLHAGRQPRVASDDETQAHN